MERRVAEYRPVGWADGWVAEDRSGRPFTVCRQCDGHTRDEASP